MKRFSDEERRNPKRLCRQLAENSDTFGIFKKLPEEILQVQLCYYIMLFRIC